MKRYAGLHCNDAEVKIKSLTITKPKTALGAGIVYAHSQKKAGTSSIIMCPGHLVEKWKREVERLIPNAKGYIIEHINDLMCLEDKIKDKNKKEHMFVIVSKEVAKFDYETRPAAIWSASKKCFVCPTCGKPLLKDEWLGTGRNRVKIRSKLTERDFSKAKAFNMICDNEIEKIDRLTGKKIKEKCNSTLWTPLNRYESNPKWIKLGTDGWIMKKHIRSVYNELFAKRQELDKKEQQYLSKLMDKIDELDETGDAKSSTKGVRKYSIARYVKEKLKGQIDYLLLDELK